MQVLQADWDRTFSEASFGFRPERSAHQAVERAQAYIASGHAVVVDIDLEKFFDRVNHDILMGLVAKRVADKRILRLIRGFLTAGVLEGGLVSPTEEGTPQGGPLSPLLSNLMLDVLDKELEKRGHRFVRYADDCNIYVRSQRAALAGSQPSSLRRAGGHAWIEIDASALTRQSLALDPWPITASPDNIVLIVAGGGHPTNSYWLQGYSPGVVGREIHVPSPFGHLLDKAASDLDIPALAP